MKPAPFDYARPGALPQAVAQARDETVDVKFVAGGQSLGPMLNLRLARAEQIVDVSLLSELRGTRETDTYVEIGAATRHAEIEDGETPEPIAGMMRHVAAGIAYRAVRNKGTIGGSLCHADPAADWVTAMTALDATLRIDGSEGHTRDVPMTAFMQGAYRTALEPGEVLSAIRVPKYTSAARWGYYKICRKVGEFADAIAAFVADPERRYCRVVFGAVSGAPLVSQVLARRLAETGAAAAMGEVKAELNRLDPALDEIKRHQLAVAWRRCVAEALDDA